MTYFPQSGTAPIDLTPARRVDIHGREIGCIFRCGHDPDIYMLQVEMNRDVDGTLHAQQDHINHAVRVAGYAHAECYRAWYERTYGVPFTMTP